MQRWCQLCLKLKLQLFAYVAGDLEHIAHSYIIFWPFILSARNKIAWEPSAEQPSNAGEKMYVKEYEINLWC